MSSTSTFEFVQGIIKGDLDMILRLGQGDKKAATPKKIREFNFTEIANWIESKWIRLSLRVHHNLLIGLILAFHRAVKLLLKNCTGLNRKIRFVHLVKRTTDEELEMQKLKEVVRRKRQPCIRFGVGVDTGDDNDEYVNDVNRHRVRKMRRVDRRRDDNSTVINLMVADLRQITLNEAYLEQSRHIGDADDPDDNFAPEMNEEDVELIMRELFPRREQNQTEQMETDQINEPNRLVPEIVITEASVEHVPEMGKNATEAHVMYGSDSITNEEAQPIDMSVLAAALPATETERIRADRSDGNKRQRGRPRQLQEPQRPKRRRPRRKHRRKLYVRRLRIHKMKNQYFVNILYDIIEMVNDEDVFEAKLFDETMFPLCFALTSAEELATNRTPIVTDFDPMEIDQLPARTVSPILPENHLNVPHFQTNDDIGPSLLTSMGSNTPSLPPALPSPPPPSPPPITNTAGNRWSLPLEMTEKPLHQNNSEIARERNMLNQSNYDHAKTFYESELKPLLDCNRGAVSFDRLTERKSRTDQILTFNKLLYLKAEHLVELNQDSCFAQLNIQLKN